MLVAAAVVGAGGGDGARVTVCRGITSQLDRAERDEKKVETSGGDRILVHCRLRQ